MLLGERIGAAIRDHIRGVAQKSVQSQAAPQSRQLALPGLSAKAPSPKRERVTGLSFFTGAGGLMLGFQNAGVDVLASYDLKSSVARNAEVNFPDVPHHKADIGSLTVADVS